MSLQQLMNLSEKIT